MATGIALPLGVTRALNLAHGEMIVAGGHLGYWLWAGGVSVGVICSGG